MSFNELIRLLHRFAGASRVNYMTRSVGDDDWYRKGAMLAHVLRKPRLASRLCADKLNPFCV